MNPMAATENLTAESIRELIKTPGPCITIVLEGDPSGNTAIELKDAIGVVRKQLESKAADAGSLLASIRDAREELRGDTKSKGRVAILSAPSIFRVYRVGGSVRPIARAGEHFDLRTLLAIENAQKAFYILALSQRRTRVLRCTEHSSEEVAMPGAPTSLAEALQTDKPDHVLDNRSFAGPSMGSGSGVVFGTSSDADGKDQYLLHFFAELDKAVTSTLRGSDWPMIPAGVEHEIALYRRVNTYPHLVEPGIHGAPDGLEGGEMHRRALELLEQRAAQPGSIVPSDFDKRVGTGHATTRIQEIVLAAWEGRVSHLFLQQNASYMGAFDSIRLRVKHSEDPRDSPVDLIDFSGEQTILHGGEVRLLAASAMPNGVPVCALMRYPPAQIATGSDAAA